jgi:Putative sensor
MSTARAASRFSRSPHDSLLRLPSNPLRLLFSAAPWRAAAYLGGGLVVSTILFALAFTFSVAAAVLSITIVAAPLLIAAAAVVRGCASAEGGTLRLIFPVALRGARQERPPAGGLWARTRAAWDARTWRDAALVMGLWIPFYVLDFVVFTIWLVLLAGISMPLWYWAPTNSCIGYCVANNARGVQLGSFPHGPHGPGAHGLYIDTLPEALLAAAGFAILFLIFNYVLVLTARVRGRVVRAVLGPSADPLAEAKRVLERPGPLGSFSAVEGGPLSMLSGGGPPGTPARSHSADTRH